MKSFGLAAAILATTMLAGCGTVRGAFGALDHRPRDAYPGPTLDMADRASERIRNLGVALTFDDLPNCTLPANGGPPTCGQVQLTDTHYDLYLDRSIMLIDANCSAYLDSLATLGASSRWTRSQFNTVTNYIGVLMALAGQSAEAMGYLDAGSAFFNSSADNLEALVLISPTPHKLTPLVASAQQAKRLELTRIRQSDNRLRWSETSRWIESYASQCTPRGMRILLDEAIDNSAASSTPAALETAAESLAPEARAVLLSLTAFKLPTPVVVNSIETGAQLGALTWRIQAGDLTTSQRSYIDGVLGPEISEALSRALAEPSQRAQLVAMVSGPRRSAFGEFRRVEEARWAAQSAEANALTARQNEAAARQREAAARQAEATALQDAERERRLREQAEAQAATLSNQVLELLNRLAATQPTPP